MEMVPIYGTKVMIEERQVMIPGHMSWRYIWPRRMYDGCLYVCLCIWMGFGDEIDERWTVGGESIAAAWENSDEKKRKWRWRQKVRKPEVKMGWRVKKDVLRAHRCQKGQDEKVVVVWVRRFIKCNGQNVIASIDATDEDRKQIDEWGNGESDRKRGKCND